VKRLAPLLICLGWLAAGGSVFSQDVPADTVVTLQRGACERRCSVYKVILFADGTVIYDGQYWVRQKGLVRDRVEPQVLDKFVREAQAAGFFHLNNEYGYQETKGCEHVATDGPLVKISVVSGGQVKSILHNHRCSGADPDKLTALEDRIDSIARTARWVK
jgi:hypothetical protein